MTAQRQEQYIKLSLNKSDKALLEKLNVKEYAVYTILGINSLDKLLK